jgi:SH3-like domain-containing protein
VSPYLQPAIKPRLRPAAAVAAFLALSLAFAAALAGERPLPRFVSLRADEVKMRTGPGVQYPVEWVFSRLGLPVEIIAEYQNWRKVRDWQGTQGWMHQSLLSAKRTFIVTGAVRAIRKAPAPDAGPVARAEAGVVGGLVECPENGQWCRVGVEGYEGWLRRVDFWGVYPNEAVK